MGKDCKVPLPGPATEIREILQKYYKNCIFGVSFPLFWGNLAHFRRIGEFCIFSPFVGDFHPGGFPGPLRGKTTPKLRNCCADFGRPLTKKVMMHSRDGLGVTARLQTNIVSLMAVWIPPSLPLPPLKVPDERSLRPLARFSGKSHGILCKL